MTQSLALAIRSRLPDTAYALAPWDARVEASFAAELADSGAPSSRDQADRLAAAALLRDPTAVAAVSVRGVIAALDKDEAEARSYFSFSDRLSRRDLRTRLWLIEDAVGRGDLAAALSHYDVALRTSRQAPELLFPVLSTAIADPRIQEYLSRTLSQRPNWLDSFVESVSYTGDPVDVAAFYGRLARAGVAIPPSVRAGLVDRLVSAGALDASWTLYRRYNAAANKRFSRDPRFTTRLERPSGFDWVPVQQDGAFASIQAEEDGGFVSFSAPAAVGGPVLSQRQLLPPGRYSLSGRSAEIDQQLTARPYWLITCADGRELGRVVMTNSPDSEARFNGRFVVPADCPMQTLALITRASTQVGGTTGRILEAQIRPAP
ncbi:hypothetical protein GGR88_002397 [Sphingomonas jejuensis]|uniref:Tetratricopeptide repeat protein n=1 Tax=Sphingomonas jejuensis TaxID=904715 RepID=A0ABX0XNU6_9SPHN|nr:hypothetical protein [Sphingomonas jejuensis]NJC34883.1 hypothetical protein [Sphingomonas jejuensis]